jgi:hypothetical protein
MTSLKVSTECPPHKFGGGLCCKGTVVKIVSLPILGAIMPESPLRPNPFAVMHFWGGDGEGEGAEVNVSIEPGGSGGEGEGEGNESDENTKKLKETQDKLTEAEKRAKEAEKRAKDLEKQTADKAKEGMEQAERDAAERDEYKEKYEKLLEFVETSVIDHEIMKLSAQKTKDGSPKYDWHDAAALRSFIDRDALELDMDNNTVDGLEAQLKDLAKQKPWLLVSQQESAGEGTPPPAGPATGSHPRGGIQYSREKDPNKLRTKYKMPGYASTMSRPM